MRGRLAADASRAQQLAAELAAALATIPTAAIDGEGQPAEAEPPTGWENELGELAHRLTMLANTIKASARDHQAVAADWRHAARTAGFRRAPAPTAVVDEIPGRAEAPGDLVVELPGRDWDETDVCLWRTDGHWHLYGPDGEIDVDGFGRRSNSAVRSARIARSSAAEPRRARRGGALL
ncbi:hypothetical protein [Nonomuraea recticatena]|uniref:hypothetical protein n=1 Tax=Nonomuraea recticatena TaxID=46178 RepID=UPI00361BC57F